MKSALAVLPWCQKKSSFAHMAGNERLWTMGETYCDMCRLHTRSNEHAFKRISPGRFIDRGKNAMMRLTQSRSLWCWRGTNHHGLNRSTIIMGLACMLYNDLNSLNGVQACCLFTIFTQTHSTPLHHDLFL